MARKLTYLSFHSKKKAGLLSLLSVVALFSATAGFADPFTGAFVEGALGGSSGRTKFDTTTAWGAQWAGISSPNPVTAGANQSKSAVVGRLGVGYGYTLAPQLNLSGMLTYSTPQKVDAAGSKLKNNVSLLLQPGYYFPSARTLVYGTLGYATASYDLSQRSISVNDRDLFLPGTGDADGAATRTSPPIGDGSFRVNGLVVGLGAKYAATDRLYVGLDYTHTEYHGTKEGDLREWQGTKTKKANGDEPSLAVLNTHWQAKVKATDTFLITVGYRFF